MKILASADIHIGRIPSVEQYKGLTSHSSWDAVVNKAIELKVDVLVLAGDVIEQTNAWFEAYGPFITGLKKLGECGIKIIGVGGNHDHKAFPSLAASNEFITILGLGEKWESIDYKGVRFIGYSFASSRIEINPFNTFDENLIKTHNLLVGILHCDVGLKVSNYAPVTIDDFDKSRVPLWVLGHIHSAQKFYKKALYCGSPYPLDSGERGEHGAFLLETAEDGLWQEATFVPLSPYRFEQVSINLEGAISEEDVKNKLVETVTSYAQKTSFLGDIFCSITLRGNIDRTLNISSIFTPEGLENFYIEINGCKIHILPDYIDNTFLDVNLEELSLDHGTISLLAQKLLNEKEIESMVEEYKRIEKSSSAISTYRALQDVGLKKTDEEYREIVLQAGKKLLFSMINRDTQ